jgi:transposase
MISMPESLPNGPILLKQLLLSLHEQVSEKDGQILQLREQNALLIQRLFGRKFEQTIDPDSPQLWKSSRCKSG